MKNVLITGGAGFIGSRLCEKLFDKGYHITVLDNLSAQVHGNNESVLFEKIKDKCSFIKGDVCNKKIWPVALKGQDILIHLAAETGTGQSMYELSKYNNVNIMGTTNMLDCLAQENHNVKKIIIASSRAIYGEGKYMCSDHGATYPQERSELLMQKGDFDPKCMICDIDLRLVGTDEKSKINPLSIYAMNKYCQEMMVMLMGKRLNIPTVSLRYQNVYGPGQSLSNPYTGIISIFSTRLLNGNNLDIYEDGLESRDFVFVDDAVDATILCMQSANADGEIFNVGSGKNTTVIEVAQSLIRLLDSQGKTSTSGKYRLGDIRHNYADITKIHNILGYSPKYSFQDGLAEFVKWVQNQKIVEDNYEESVKELKDKGLIK